MTERLYHSDAYLRTFDAVVQAQDARADGLWLRLDCTAFYPTGGGQPHDLGTLRAQEKTVRVLDVLADAAGDVWHRVDGELPAGSAVQGEIDWARRLDHMQQHLGEHVLAGSLHQLTGGFTHGLHIGQEVNTIDVTLPDGRTRLTAEEVTSLELLANQRVQQDDPVKCWFPDAQEMQALPLRKDPTVDEHVRIVAVGSYEHVACGGTHVSSTGQVGQIKVLSTDPARGKLRVTFVCGMRALKSFQRVYAAAQEAGQLLSAPPEELAGALNKRLDELAALREQVSALKEAQAESLARQLLADAASLPQGGRLVKAHLAGQDAEGLKTIAGLLLKAEPQVVVLLSAPRGEGAVLLFARGEQAQGDMAQLLRQCGAKGGGRPDFAQGSGETQHIQRAYSLLMEAGRDPS